MKKVLLTAMAVLVSSAAFAQAAPSAGAAPSGTATKEEITGQKGRTDQAVADKAQARVDNKKGMSPMSSNAGTPAMMAMDSNGDGMISRREYDAHHAAMWRSMKQTKGMVSRSDMDLMLKGGPSN